MSTSKATRGVVVTAVGSTAIAYTAQAADPINIVKLTLLLYATTALLALGAVAAVRSRTLVLPREPVAAAAVAFLGVALVATAAAPDTGTAVLGQYQRNTGLLFYLCCAVMLAGVLLAFDVRGLELLVRSLLVVGAAFAAYGLLQAADLDPVRWSNPFTPILLTLGNPNFASAYLGMLVPVAAYGAMRRTWSTRWRASTGGLAAVLFGLAAYSGSAQGPLCAVAGLAVLVLARLLDARDPIRRRGIVALGVAVVAGAAVVLSAMLGNAPSDRVGELVTAKPRQWYWEAAVRMFADRPWRGVGLDSYGAFYRAFRPDAATEALGPEGFTDSAHSVPLSMFAWGGVLLGVAFLVLLGVVAAALVAGLSRHAGERRLLLGALGGAWVAWVVQGLVSIEQVPITLLGWVLAGATVVAARSGPPRQWVLLLPGSSPPVKGGASSGPQRRPKGGKAAAPRRPRRRSWTTVDRVAVGAVVGVAVVGVGFSTVPLRADLAARRGDEAVVGQRAEEAFSSYRKAVDLAPWRGAYWSRLGQLYEAAKRPELAYTAYLSGAEHDPRVIDVLAPAAQLAEQLGHHDEAARLYRRLYEVDPDSPGTLTPYAKFLIAKGDAARAVDMLQVAVDGLHSDNAALWLELGNAQQAVGDNGAARAAYERVLALEPGHADATQALEALGPA